MLLSCSLFPNTDKEIRREDYDERLQRLNQILFRKKEGKIIWGRSSSECYSQERRNTQLLKRIERVQYHRFSASLSKSQVSFLKIYLKRGSSWYGKSHGKRHNIMNDRDCYVTTTMKVEFATRRERRRRRYTSRWCSLLISFILSLCERISFCVCLIQSSATFLSTSSSSRT